ERSTYLDRVCAGDAALRAEVESLLHDEVPSIMKTGGLAARVAPILDDGAAAVGRRVGPYRLAEVLGEGGMGVVYRAEQTEPIHREVALKLVRPGMDSARVISRFESERQALAVMDHPGIARVFDAGSTGDGRPYFVMELVRGEPITDLCARERPDLAVRLRFFLQVCEAVQHAHQRGIIHRDLKPSNVLLTHQGVELVPKIIDFGIAKATDQAAAVMFPGTLEGQILGTPEYMSPEQAGIIDAGVDTRTDVYALGVVLYELVSGRRPYELQKRTALELERALRTPPKPPSQIDPAAASTFVRRGSNDIDAVALMAMERQPDDRYASVEQLADDVRRVIECRPVRARTQTWAYRSRRFVRRNAAAVATATLVALLLVVSGVEIVRQRNLAIASEARAVHEADTARTEAEKASEVARFLTELFRESDPARARGAAVTARELLERGADRVSTELASQDGVRATLMDTIGVVYRLLGQLDQSEALTKEALDIRRRTLGDEHPDVATSLDNLGQIARERSTYEIAEQYHRQSLEMRRRLLAPGHPDVAQSLHNLALTLKERGQYDEAEALGQEALASRRAHLGPDHPDTLSTASVLADIQFARGRPAEAEQLHRAVLEARRRVLLPGHPLLAASISNVADGLAQSGRVAEAVPLFREALEMRRKIYDPDHSAVSAGINNLASALHDLGRLTEAEPLYREALASDRRQSGNQHMDVAVDLNNLASLLEDRGELKEAGRLFQESLEIRLALQGERHPSVATVLNNIGRLRFRRGELGEAERALRRALAIREGLDTGRHPRQATTLTWLGRVLEARGSLTEAEGSYRRALAINRSVAPEGSWGLATTSLSLGSLLTRKGDPASGEPLLAEAVNWRRKSLPVGHLDIGDAEAALGECLFRQSRLSEAEPLLRSALLTAPARRDVRLYDRRSVSELLAALHQQAGRPEAAAAVLATRPGAD
ncbi:MAG TPA: serine/threonine-protein kinase, partial [Vicinamibacterales bacterium]|nr:serine/threonine-protein kinase [Vicinamibacterales bacterium]